MNSLRFYKNSSIHFNSSKYNKNTSQHYVNTPITKTQYQHFSISSNNSPKLKSWRQLKSNQLLHSPLNIHTPCCGQGNDLIVNLQLRNITTSPLLQNRRNNQSNHYNYDENDEDASEELNPFRSAVRELFQNKKYRKEAETFGLNKKRLKNALKQFIRYVEGADTEVDIGASVRSRIESRILFEDVKPADVVWEEFIEFGRERLGMRGMRRMVELTDLRDAPKLYPAARDMDRTIYIHCGPTNSGKSHSAMERLKSASSGLYCAPLRLLAAEAYSRINESGVKCNLLVGDDEKRVEGAQHVASTVEMANMIRPVECAVIDEIQLLSDEERGWAWTRALLGIPAKEVHVCGEDRAMRLVADLCSSVGEKVYIDNYQRLTPLQVLPRSLKGKLENLKEGDCLVAFSRKLLFKLKTYIESNTPHRCAVVYGGLPAETRVQQAELFNRVDSGYSILLATDAIALGLNLNIRRMVFHRMEKHDGTALRPLTYAHIRQIAGRAGRYNSRFPEGYVTCMRDEDMGRLHDAIHEKHIEPLKSAGLVPTEEQMEMFAREFPELNLEQLFEKFTLYAKLDGNFFVCDLEDKQKIAGALENVDLTLAERFTMCLAPVDTDSNAEMSAFMRFTVAHSEGMDVPLGVRIPRQQPVTLEQLMTVESAYSILDLYLWLSYRFPETFVFREEAEEMQAQCINIINTALEESALFSSSQQGQTPTRNQNQSKGAQKADFRRRLRQIRETRRLERRRDHHRDKRRFID